MTSHAPLHKHPDPPLHPHLPPPPPPSPSPTPSVTPLYYNAINDCNYSLIVISKQTASLFYVKSMNCGLLI